MIVSNVYHYHNELFRLKYEPGNSFFTLENLNASSVNVPCRCNDDFCIKENKSSLSGCNGAQGIFCFLSDAIKNDFMTAYVNAVIDKFYYKSR